MQKKFFNNAMLIALFGLILDQISKAYILFGLKLAGGYSNGMPVLMSNNHAIKIADFFNIVLVWNHGVSFGMLNSGQINPAQILLLSILTIIIIAFVFKMLRETKIKTEAYAFGLIISGALGNLIDRIIYGAVVDFLDFHYLGWHWPAFNIADSAIFIGVLLLVFAGFFVKGDSHEKK